jgi:Holliday junction resolvase
MVGQQDPEQSFSPGDRVTVPWGLDVLEATVVSTHGAGANHRVVVNVDLPDTEDESGSQLVTFPARELEAVAHARSERRPGAWLPAYRYEQALRSALENLVNLGLNVSSQVGGESPADPRVDFLVNDGNHLIVIEAKAVTSGRVRPEAIDQLLSYLVNHRATAGLLVTNALLSEAARARLEQAHEEGLEVQAVRWDSPDDNSNLDRVIRELLLAA